MVLSAEDKLAILEGVDLSAFAFSPPNDPRETPRYSISEGALFIHLPEKTLRSWVSGRSFPTIRGEKHSPPIIVPADPQTGSLSFYNLIEAHILKSTRQRDEVPMKAIRDALDNVAEAYPSPHPLITQEFLTDGRFLFVKRLNDLINATKMGQLGIEPILKDYLNRIDRDSLGKPVTLYPFIPTRPTSRSVSIKYSVSSGAPVITGTGVLVSVIWGRKQAGDTLAELAADYEIDQAKIEDAIEYLDAA
jgi:uncharacterized protein (DUF433 family)